MAYDMQRQRLAGSILACAEGLALGHSLEMRVLDIAYAFDAAPGGTSIDGFLTALPGAAWDYGHKVEQGMLTIRRIERDGLRRYVAPDQRGGFTQVGEVFWPRHAAVRDA